MTYTDEQIDAMFAEIKKYADNLADWVNGKHLVPNGDWEFAYVPDSRNEFFGKIQVEYFSENSSLVRAFFYAKKPSMDAQITNKSIGFAVSWLQDKYAQWLDAHRNQKESRVDEHGDTLETCYLCKDEDLVEEMYNWITEDGKRTPLCQHCADSMFYRGEITEDELEPLADYNFYHESNKRVKQIKKTNNKGYDMTTKGIIKQIKAIQQAIRNGNVSYGEIAFITQPHVQEIIKKYFPGDIDLRQWANIPEYNESVKKTAVRSLVESVLREKTARRTTNRKFSVRESKKSAVKGKATVSEMITVKIDENAALDMLMTRLERWTTTPQILKLYENMYQNYIDGGVFDGGEFDPMVIVDNDWVNYCNVIEEGEEYFDKLLAAYKEQGLGDISTEHINGISSIEAVDDEEEPTMFLIRY